MDQKRHTLNKKEENKRKTYCYTNEEDGGGDGLTKATVNNNSESSRGQNIIAISAMSEPSRNIMFRLTDDL